MSVSQGSKILASDCVSTNTASTLVLRDSSGNFSAGTITSLLSSSRTTAGDFISLSHGTRSGGCIKIETLGVANTEGWVTLILGNTTNKSEKDNASGRIKLYNSYGNYITIEAKHGVLSDIHATNNQNYIEITNYTKGTFIGTYYGTYYGTYTSNRTTVGNYISLYQNNAACGSLKLETLGPVNTTGVVTLTLGNNIARTAVNNARGKIILYAPTTASTTISCQQNAINNTRSSSVHLDISEELLIPMLSVQKQLPAAGSGTVSTLIGVYASSSNDASLSSNALYLSGSAGTTSNEGEITLEIGNSTKAGTVNNMNGRLKLYEGNGSAWDLKPEFTSSKSYLKLNYGSLYTNVLQLRDDGAIKGSFLTKVSTGNKTFTSSTSWFYTGAYVTIPANCYYFLRGAAVFQNSSPTGVAFGTSSTPGNGWEQNVSINGGSGWAGSVSVCGFTDGAAITFYLHAKYGSAASNFANITGGYIQSWQ